MIKVKRKYNFCYTASFTSKIISPKNIKELKKYLVKDFTIIGNLRSYGDTFIGSGRYISLSNFRKIINLDIKKKIIEIETGVSLKEMNDTIFKKGLILECMPGCKYVSIGGMISNNISGKLLFKNKLKNYIHSLKLINNKNKIIECSPYKNKKLFDLTIGGMGRTGPIISAKLKLKKLNSSLINQKIYRFQSYKNFLKLISKINKFKYGVCWIDFTKKNFDGIIFLGSHLNIKGEKNYSYSDLKMPNIIVLILSIFLKIKLTTKIFNYIFKLKNIIIPNKVLNLNSYFFPQNKILNWNDFFKSEGFIQFQIYFKTKDLNKIIETIKEEMSKYNIFSNFAVIKFFSDKKNKYDKLSLSLDFPINNNLNKIKKFINNVTLKNNLEVELSKDIVLDNINSKTMINNEILNINNKRYINKNFKSNIFKRLDHA
tara:strand:- start:38 stop:1324 length:1287 start_codon:yes stop_codon:yes gene_type:complete